MHEDQYNRFVKRAKKGTPKTISEHTPSKQDEIIRMALEAGFETKVFNSIDGDEVIVRHSNGSWICISDELDCFAALVAAHEREACAKVCDEGWKEGLGAKYQGDVFAAAIRARGVN